MADRIDYDDRGNLDDVVIEDVEMFRLERMSAGHFWLCCYREGKPSVSFWLHSSRKITGSHEMQPGLGAHGEVVPTDG